MTHWRYKYAQLNGEWFIDADGDVSDADGNIGDNNHETRAAAAMLGDLYDKWSEFFYAGGEPLTEEEKSEVESNAPGFLAYMDSGGEARDWVVEKYNWIRVHGTNFQLWQLNSDAISRIADFLVEQLSDEDDIDNTEIAISEDSTRTFKGFTVEQLLKADSDSDSMSRLLLRFRNQNFASCEQNPCWQYKFAGNM